MRQATLSIIGSVTAGLLWATPSHAAEDQFWLCHRPDGSEVYTSDPSALPNCKQYTPPAVITPAPEPDQDRAARDQPRKYYERAPARERRQEEKPKLKGEIGFEKFRMLDTGMTEAEILARAGSPKHIFRFGRNIERWVYTTPDEWLIEVTFLSGRVSNIDWYRPRP